MRPWQKEQGDDKVIVQQEKPRDGISVRQMSHKHRAQQGHLQQQQQQPNIKL